MVQQEAGTAFIKMPFSLYGAAANFQRLMDKVLRTLSYFALTYIDDIIFSHTWEERLTHLQRVLQRLQETYSE